MQGILSERIERLLLLESFAAQYEPKQILIEKPQDQPPVQ